MTVASLALGIDSLLLGEEDGDVAEEGKVAQQLDIVTLLGRASVVLLHLCSIALQRASLC